MSAAIRPKCVSTSAVMWLYVGAAFLNFGLVQGLGALWARQMMAEYGVAGGFENMALAAGLYGLSVGTMGLYGAIRLLRLEERGRLWVQRANCAAVFYLAVFAYLAWDVVSGKPGMPSVSWEQARLGLASLVFIGLLSIPFIRSLRSLGAWHIRELMSR